MSTIVSHKVTSKKYVLLGTGLGMYQSKGINPFGKEEQGAATVGVCCDEAGTVGWIDMNDLLVVSIDGALPSHVLNDRPYR